MMEAQADDARAFTLYGSSSIAAADHLERFFRPSTQPQTEPEPVPPLRRFRIAIDGCPQELLFTRRVPAVVVLEDGARQRNARRIGIDALRLVGGRASSRPRFPRRDAAVVAANAPGIGERSVRVDEVGIALHRRFEFRDRLRGTPAGEQIATLEIPIVCLDVLRLAGGAAAVRLRVLQSEGRRDRLRDLVLHREDVGQFAVPGPRRSEWR